MEDKDYEENIGMLLDIEHLYGQHEGRITPLVITLSLVCGTVLLYIYFGLSSVIPIAIAIPIWFVFSIRVVMIFMGKERERVKIFKKQLNSDYTNIANMLNIKTIHPDGCVEYVNQRIVYFVCCFNGTSDSEVRRSMQLRKLLESMIGDYVFDTYIHNLNDLPALRDYYEKVSNFDRNASARNFIDIIDHNIKLTESNSIVQCTVYAIKGFRSDWKNIKTAIDTSIGSRNAKCYKEIFRVSDPDTINDLLNRNIDGIINTSELIRHKYATQQYGTSKVLAYDLADDAEIVQGRGAEQKVVNDVAPRKSFHVNYEENNRV